MKKLFYCTVLASLTFTAAAGGGTYCGWLNCGGTIVCETMMQLGPNYYSVDFHY